MFIYYDYIIIYIFIYTHPILRIYMYLCAKTIPIANKLVSFVNELANAYSAQLICNLILNSDWSKQVYLLKF